MIAAHRRSAGFSLTELMVALTIGLLILAAATLLLVNSKKHYTVQDSLARLQENARFAMRFLTDDIRIAGHYGCVAIRPLEVLDNGGLLGSPFPLPIDGATGSNSGPPSNFAASGDGVSTMDASVASGTDVVTVQYADQGDDITAAMKQAGDVLTIQTPTSWAKGNVGLVSDCYRGDVFQVTAVNNTNKTLSHAPAQLGKIYDTTDKTMARVYKIDNRTYYIRRNAAGIRSLYRRDQTTATPQELVEGVETMKITYGVDFDGDYTPDKFVPAESVATTWGSPDTGWNHVVAVRIGLLVSSIANSSTPGAGTDKQFGTDVDTATYLVNGTKFKPANFADIGLRRERRVFEWTIILRDMRAGRSMRS